MQMSRNVLLQFLVLHLVVLNSNTKDYFQFSYRRFAESLEETKSLVLPVKL